MPDGLTKALDSVANRLRHRPDTEHVQALIRVVVTGIGAAYLNLVPSQTDAALWACRLITGYFVTSVIIIGWILQFPAANRLRRNISMFLDHTVLSLGLLCEASRGAPFFMLYLWTTLGNGFRFGVQALLWSAGIAAVEFGLVVAFSEFWQSVLYVSIGLMVTLIAIPAYTSSLIRQLIASRAAAEQANRAKSRFLATASHELRTPLHAIIGLSELMQQTALTSEQSEMLQTVRGSGRTLLSLVEDVLEISSAQAGKVSATPGPFSLYDGIAEAVAIIRPQTAAKHLDLTVHIDPNVPDMLVGDWKHTRQIMLNLLTNATKFTEEGYISLSVSSPKRTSGGMHLRFDVRDTGIGIARENFAVIFETFSQVNASATRKHGGVGLGLAIVRQLADLLKATITVDSVEGQGSCFTLELQFETSASTIDQTAHTLPHMIVCSTDGNLQHQVRRLVPAASACTLPEEIQAPEGDGPVLVITGADHGGRDGLKTFSDSVAEQLGGRAVAMMMLVDDPADAASMHSACVTYAQLPLERESFDGSCRIAAKLATHPDIFDAVRARPEPELPVVSAPVTVNGTGHRVLVVDDSPVNRMVTSKILVGAGYQVTLAETGDEALEILSDEDFSLILLDLNMPGTSGIDTLKLYKIMRMGMPLAPIAIFSAEVTQEVREECLQLGVALFLPKPSEPAFMLEQLAIIAPPLPEAVEVPQPVREPVTITAISSHPRYNADADLAVMDRQALQNLAALDPNGTEFLTELTSAFESDSIVVLDAIDRSVRMHDMHDFWDQIHALRSSAANVGARQICVACNDISAQGKTSFNTRGPEYAARLRYEFTRFNRAIGRYLALQTRASGSARD